MGKTFRAPDPYSDIFNSEEPWKITRDKKRWYKPGKIFKKLRRKAEKAKAKDALKHEEDPPIVKKNDVYEWN